MSDRPPIPTPRKSEPRPAMNPTVRHEDNHCLVVDKPAGLLTQGDRTGDPSLVDWVAEYWKVKYAKPGNVYVGLIHRLDRPTSGLVLLARTSKAAGRLSEQFRLGSIRKTYFAVCEGSWVGESGVWEDRLVKDGESNRVRVVGPGGGDGQSARVAYEVAFRAGRMVGILLNPLTGRGHQLRVQLASRGLPIVGDAKYGARSRLMASDGLPRIALHAARLSFTHPMRGGLCEVRAPLPSDWPDVVPASGTAWPDSSTPGELPGR